MGTPPLKVILACNFARDEKLGTSRTPLRLATELERLGIDISLLFAEDLPRVPGGRVDQLTAPMRMALTLRRRAADADVVDIAGFDAWAYAGLARRWRPRQVVVSRSNGLWYRASAASPEAERGAARALMSRVYQQQILYRWERASIVESDLALFLSHADADEIVRRKWRDPQEVAVVSPGVDDFFASAIPLERRRNVAFVGTFFHRKGSDIVSTALSRVLRSRPTLGLTLFGTGLPSDAVKAAFDMSVRSQITVVEAMPSSLLARRLEEFAVLVFPTRYEGFGIVVLEAMRAGLAVVTTPTGAGADIVRDGEDGLVVPIGAVDETADAVARLVDDTPLRVRLARAAVAKAQSRTWAQAANQLLEAYSSARFRAARRS